MSNSIVTSVGSFLNKSLFTLRKNSPKILLAGGVVGVLAGGVMACVATTKVESLVDETQERVNKVHNKLAENKPEEYNEEDSKKDLALIYTQAVIGFVKLYAPSLLVTLSSLACILGSHKIMKDRNTAALTYAASISNAFQQYRKNVVDRFGEETDTDLRHGFHTEKITDTVLDENGEEKTIKRPVKVMDEDSDISIYSITIDSDNPNYCENIGAMQDFVNMMQSNANDYVYRNGYMFLERAYKQFRIPINKAAHMVGWVYDRTGQRYNEGKGDNQIRYVMNTIYRKLNNGDYEHYYIIDFNVDGDITPIFTDYMR